MDLIDEGALDKALTIPENFRQKSFKTIYEATDY